MPPWWHRLAWNACKIIILTTMLLIYEHMMGATVHHTHIFHSHYFRFDSHAYTDVADIQSCIGLWKVAWHNAIQSQDYLDVDPEIPITITHVPAVNLWWSMLRMIISILTTIWFCDIRAIIWNDILKLTIGRSSRATHWKQQKNHDPKLTRIYIFKPTFINSTNRVNNHRVMFF